MNLDTLRQWLQGEPVELNGLIYVFPHGSSIIRKWVENDGYKNFVTVTMAEWLAKEKGLI